MFNRSVRLLAAMLFVFVFAASVKAGGITILAPKSGGNVSSKDIILIGKTSESVKEIIISGISDDGLKIRVNRGGFFTKIKLTGTTNKITLSADDGSTAVLDIKVDSTDGFNYHPDADEVFDCSSICHNEPEKNGYANKPTASVCYECHDPNNDKAFVHGPVNMGICEVCHMPHGSASQNFLLGNVKTLCISCHDSLMSTHPDTGKKICVDCHDPHSSDSEFHIK